MLAISIYLLIFFFCASWGSFANVVIYRLPRGKSVIKPASACPTCGQNIAFYDNIPVLSWFILRGKCRRCKAPFSFRYPAIELIAGLLGTGLFQHIVPDRLMQICQTEARLASHGMDICIFNDTLAIPTQLSMPLFYTLTAWLFLFAFSIIMLIVAMIDYDETIVPVPLVIVSTIAALVAAWVLPESGITANIVGNISPGNAIIGAATGAGVIVAIIAVYYLITRRIGMGAGDAWLMLLVGAVVGWQGLFFIFFAASIQGIIAAFAGIFLGSGQQNDSDNRTGLFRNDILAQDELDQKQNNEKKDPATNLNNDKDTSKESLDTPSTGKLAIPFGPFIALAAVEYLFVASYVVPWLSGGALTPWGWMP